MKLFIWDFHGVLEKGNENSVMEISNKVLEDSGYTERFSSEDCDRYYGLKWYEYFERLLPKAAHEEHMRLQYKCFDTQDSNPQIIAKHMMQNDHVDSVLEVIKNRHHQILISNTHSAGLKMFIRTTKIESYFTEANTFAANAHKDGVKQSKKELLDKFLEDKRNKYEEIISIGDSVDDILLVKDLPNSKTYLYAHPYRTHKEVNATYRINDLREVLKEV